MVVPAIIIVAWKTPLVDIWFREPDTICRVPVPVPEGVAELLPPLPFTVVATLPSDVVA